MAERVRQETAYVLFMDIVSYSPLQNDEQMEIVDKLQDIVRNTEQFRAAKESNELIARSIGDGIALAFFGDPERAAECALEVARSVRAEPVLRVRIGLHCGPVYKAPDINYDPDLRGVGMNVAQRVMAAGDAGHILLSDHMAQNLRTRRWAPHLYDFGTHEIKHGETIHFFNLYTGDLGLPGMPWAWQNYDVSTTALSIGVVGFSMKMTDEKEAIIAKLNAVVRQAKDFQAAESASQVVAQPTPDGMTLAFFGNPERAADCALEICEGVKNEAELPLRIGLHYGEVQKVIDSKGNRGIAGDTLVLAQRIMEPGDAGHILLSQDMAQKLHTSKWKPHLLDFGLHEGMQGDSIHFHSLYTGNIGRRDLPAIWRKPEEEDGQPAIAHVLFMDIVSYSTLPMDAQAETVQRLQLVVRASPQFKEALENNDVISLPTGDGMALVFFGDPSRAAECALEIARQLKNKPDLRVRMGLHSGPVYRHADISNYGNVGGGGINMAQRIMDAGDAGHILVSSVMAEALGQLPRWKAHLTDFGEWKVKHGVSLHFYNLYTGDAGVPEFPSRWKGSREKRGLANLVNRFRSV